MAKQTMKYKIGISILILLGLFIVGSVIAIIFTTGDTINANTAIIRVNGPIMATSPDGLFADGTVTSTGVIEKLEEAADDPAITGVILEINSPGGSAVASDEVARAVKELDKPTVAWIREVGASGAYWIASASDHVVANRMSVTGSVGVIASYIGFPEFLEEWNLTYNRLVAGERKDVGDPFQRLTYSDRQFLEEKLDTIHGIFIAAVQENRNLSAETMDAVSDGRMLLGLEAHELGLVDELGGKQEAVAYVGNVTGEEVITTVLEDEAGFLETLLGVRQSPLGVRQDVVPLAR